MENKPSEKTKSTDLILVNIVEEIVRDKTAKLMKTIDMCQCETCYLNACAIVLNTRDPLYVTTKKGALLSRISTINYAYQTDLTVEILKALMIVKNSPRH